MMYQDEYRQGIVNMRNKSVRLPREGEYWTDEEREQLRLLYDTGTGLTEIAVLLQRTELAVIQQAILMDLFSPPVKRRKRTPKPPCCLCANCKQDPAFCPRTLASQPMPEVGSC